MCGDSLSTDVKAKSRVLWGKVNDMNLLFVYEAGLNRRVCADRLARRLRLSRPESCLPRQRFRIRFSGKGLDVQGK